MIKRKIANLAARLLQAAISRIGSDVDLARLLSATFSSAELVDRDMQNARSCSSRIEVMNAAFSFSDAKGFICELGVYKGQSLNEIAKMNPNKTIYGFDTFKGLPEFWRDGFPQGAFDVAGENLVLEKNCKIYKGLFQDTLPKFMVELDEKASLIHVDCDLYSSTISALNILAPRIQKGTIIVFDEYFNYPGWQQHEYKAFNEFLEKNGLSCRYIAYNRRGQQVAIEIKGL